MRSRFPWVAALLLVLLIGLALAAPYLPLQNPVRMSVPKRMAPPSWDFPLGNDEFGRDVLSRIVWGARASLLVAFASAAIASVVGTALGVLGGYLRGTTEFMALRFVDVLLCFPPLLLALLVVTLLGPGVGTLIPVLALVFIPGFTRVAYAGVLSVRSHEYVEAVRALGAGPGRIMWRTVLPNIGGPILVQFSLVTATAVVLESGLSFLGLGVVPPAPSWGLMIGSARATMTQQPLLLLWPCLALTLTILIMNALCDGLRDLFDPHPEPASLWGRLTGLRPATDPAAPAPALLDIRDLTLEIPAADYTIRPVRDLSLHVARGETLAIVGESGSGKSLTGLAVMGLLPAVVRPAAGSIRFDGRELLDLDEAALADLRGRSVAMIFQDPMSSLNPVHRVGDQIAEAILAHGRLGRGAAMRKAVDLMASVGIPDPETRARAFPHELSGGMRQRVMIAMAIANDPVLLIADEPTTALDVTIQAQVLELLADLKTRLDLAMIFVSHSLPVVASIADRVVVLYAGELVEEGPTAAVFARPRHPYTAALLASAPDDSGRAPKPIEGTVPAPNEIPPGCVFAPRCALRVAACEASRPALESPAEGRVTRCLRWRDL
ncbi:dipeptide/oligopeptide/nickel ABC transporter permease/ATP-binding protein [Prosthecomicrobium sp. N25]|uniref:dipeptide/oligopeptide/nickel ABC transporter permease/ATP-binding protein n=1 Tax=Prosthecomicrobium sp. N25 TaxID=3129254 RepID=UPI003076EAC2